MSELKVTSKKYNDKDVLEVDNLGEAVNEEIVAGKINAQSKLYKHLVQLDLKTANTSLTGYFNYLSDNGAPITGNLDSSSQYFIIDFKTSNIIGFFGGSSSMSIPLEITGSHLIISGIVPWGGNSKGFNPEKVQTYSGASFFGAVNFTECLLTDTVTPL